MHTRSTGTPFPRVCVRACVWEEGSVVVIVCVYVPVVDQPEHVPLGQGRGRFLCPSWEEAFVVGHRGIGCRPSTRIDHALSLHSTSVPPPLQAQDPFVHHHHNPPPDPGHAPCRNVGIPKLETDPEKQWKS